MKKLKIYWTSIEYNYNKTSDKYEKLSGGFVYGFVKAIDEIEALNKFTDELRNQDKDVKEIEFISPYDIETEWETKEQTNIFIQLYNKAKSSCDVLFDTFYAYENG